MRWGMASVSSTSPYTRPLAGSLLTKLESARTEQSVINRESHAQSRIADRYHPDPSRDDLDGIEPAGQAIYRERRTSDPACSTSRCNHPCDATALFGNVCSGILSGTNRPTPDCAARRRLHHAGGRGVYARFAVDV